MITAFALTLAVLGVGQGSPIPQQITYQVKLLDLDAREVKLSVRTLDKQASKIMVKTKLGEFHLDLTPKFEDDGTLTTTLSVALDKKVVCTNGTYRLNLPAVDYLVVSKGDASQPDQISFKSVTQKPTVKPGEILVEVTGTVPNKIGTPVP